MPLDDGQLAVPEDRSHVDVVAGAVPERHAEVVDYLETWIFNSQKCFALFKP